MEELAAFIGLSWATLFWHSLICLQYVPWHISSLCPLTQSHAACMTAVTAYNPLQSNLTLQQGYHEENE